MCKLLITNINKEERIFAEMAIANNNAPIIIEEKAYDSVGRRLLNTIALYDISGVYPCVAIDNFLNDYKEMRWDGEYNV